MHYLIAKGTRLPARVSSQGRHGQLLQNRYKSILCWQDPSVLELLRYIHLNPLRARLVADLKELDIYSYCGHSALIGRKTRQRQELAYVLLYIGKRNDVARRGYRRYVEKGIALGRRSDTKPGWVG